MKCNRYYKIYKRNLEIQTIPSFFDNVITNVYTISKEGGYMTTQLKKIGNSRGIIIPAGILKTLGIHESEELMIRIEDNQIIVSKKPVFDPKTLEALFEGYTDIYQDEIVFDDIKGEEVW